MIYEANKKEKIEKVENIYGNLYVRPHTAFNFKKNYIVENDQKTEKIDSSKTKKIERKVYNKLDTNIKKPIVNKRVTIFLLTK